MIGGMHKGVGAHIDACPHVRWVLLCIYDIDYGLCGWA